MLCVSLPFYVDFFLVVRYLRSVGFGRVNSSTRKRREKLGLIVTSGFRLGLVDGAFSVAPLCKSLDFYLIVENDNGGWRRESQ